MQSTSNLNLNLLDYGTREWHTYLNDNFQILDIAVQDAISRGNSIIIDSDEPLSPRYGQIWIDITEGSYIDGMVKGKYKVYNGENFEEYKFITDAKLVQIADYENVFGKENVEDALKKIVSQIKDNSDKIGILIGDGEPQEKANKQDLETHLADITNEQGRHGIRYFNEKLEIKVGLEWIEFKSGSQYPVGNVSNFNAKGDDKQITLTWQDPINRTITDDNGETLAIAKWKGTKILRKTGSYPANENDGVLVVDNGIRNQYKTNGFIDTGLVNDTGYYYMAFPYTEDDVYTVDEASRVIGTPTEMQVYGVKIDTTNSNPKTAVTYTDDAIGLTPMLGNDGNFNGGSWMDKFPFNEIKPCLFKNGVVNYYLNPNDYTKKLDGGVADITSGNDGDVMIEFPKVYWKFERIGTDLYVRYSDVEADEDFKCLAHTVGNTEKDKIYISAYRGFSTGGKLRSLSGKTPTASQTIGQFRSLAQANGVGYQQMAYYPLLMLQVLYLVAFKDRDSQTALGRGFVDGNSAATNTGQTNTKGMHYGETAGKLQNKFCGIEDFWGNQECWIDGIFSNTSWNMLISDQTVFNDTGAGYVNHGQGATANLGGYIDDVQGGTETGFIIKGKAGSATTHYSDYGHLYGGYLASLLGYWNTGDNAGAFGLYVNRTASYSNASIGARLCNLG